jgi:HEAT repeat protein
MTMLHAVVLAVTLATGENEPTPQLYLTTHRVTSNGAVDALRASLDQIDYPSMLKAVSSLDVSDASAATDILMDGLRSSDPRIRWQAARAAGRLGVGQERLINGLLHTLKDADPLVRWASSESLAAAGSKARPIVPTLIAGLSSEDLVYRRASAEVLAKLGTHASDAVPSLLDALRDDDPTVRRWATQALREIFRTQVGSKIDLEDALTDDRGGVGPRG